MLSFPSEILCIHLEGKIDALFPKVNCIVNNNSNSSRISNFHIINSSMSLIADRSSEYYKIIQIHSSQNQVSEATKISTHLRSLLVRLGTNSSISNKCDSFHWFAKFILTGSLVQTATVILSCHVYRWKADFDVRSSQLVRAQPIVTRGGGVILVWGGSLVTYIGYNDRGVIPARGGSLTPLTTNLSSPWREIDYYNTLSREND